MGSTTTEKHLENLFRNIQIGLKKYSIEELNDKIVSITSDKAERTKNKQKNIDIVIDVICADFKLSREALLKGRGKGIVQQARMHSYCILHFDLDLPIRFIANNVFGLRWHTSVSNVIQYHKTLNTEIKPDREFNNKLDELRQKVHTKFQNQHT